jgi:mevalonate kinase
MGFAPGINMNAEPPPVPKTVYASAPGSLMLLGEHAVLHGRRALVCAIDRRISVELSPLDGDFVRIASDLGCYNGQLDRLADDPSFRFVLQAIRQHRARIPSGFALKIESEFSADIGFGSSAAVTVAVHAALMRWTTSQTPMRKELFFQSLETVHAVQGRGSGADLAAAVFGGVVAFCTKPEFQPLEVSLPLTAVYCGYKTPTPEVIEKVEQLRAADPAKYERIYSEIDASVGEALSSLRENDFPAFGKTIDRNQRLMDEMGVNTPELHEIVAALQADPGICGAKISGSGLGDCAVGIGHADLPCLGYPVHHLKIVPTGCECHE